MGCELHLTDEWVHTCLGQRARLGAVRMPLRPTATASTAGIPVPEPMSPFEASPSTTGDGHVARCRQTRRPAKPADPAKPFGPWPRQHVCTWLRLAARGRGTGRRRVCTIADRATCPHLDQSPCRPTSPLLLRPLRPSPTPAAPAVGLHRANSGHVAWRTEPRNRNVAQHVQSSFTLHRFSGDDAEVLESEDWAALLMNQKRRFLRCRRTPRARCATPSAGPPARWRICKATSQCVYRDAATSDPALAADLETPEPRPSRSTADRKPRRDRDVDEDADAGEAVFRLPCGPGRLSSGWEVVWRRRPVAGRSAARDQPASNVGGLPGVEYRWLPQVGQWSAAARGSSVGGSPATRGF